MNDTNPLTQAPGIGAIQTQIHLTRAAAFDLEKVKAKMAEMLKPFEEAAEREMTVLSAMMRAAKVDNMETPDVETGQNLRAEFMPKQAPKVKDWDVFHAWIAENKRFDMLQKRVTSAPVVELFQLAVEQYDDTQETKYPTALAYAEAELLPPGVTVSEWKELKLSFVKPKKARKAAA